MWKSNKFEVTESKKRFITYETLREHTPKIFAKESFLKPYLSHYSLFQVFPRNFSKMPVRFTVERSKVVRD